ncbi:hypothetical protein AKJ09_02647 [Labilithrix luteola]|uniref:Tryptophan synthase alpha chain n=1 Tax=Labilithrix luteola TaxID=1391654 RepID=A0A0K1PR25_9BACT|nr:hypothetical protein [Labilithrix luteola]AKU95983.1 hypothetical protein AKJ09_02647 [Labilithrix luteola]
MPSVAVVARFAVYASSLSVLLAACAGRTNSSSNDGKTSGASTLLCPASACDGQTTPPHQCVGGVASPVCAQQADGSCRKQIDCAKPDPNAPGNSGSVSSCPEGACGPQPSFDPADCVYGFASNTPSCEAHDRSVCTWHQRCRPKPCSIEEGTCNVVDRSRLGASCGLNEPCPSGSSCVGFNVGIGDSIAPVCVEGNPCALMTCAEGKQCAILESYPGQVVCSN